MPDDQAPSTVGRFLQILGLGLITGADDDDPSGIVTYSQVGAQFGYGMGWIATSVIRAVAVLMVATL
jgi:Mn2+/Fe2+ NRAMP family transporter